MLDNSQTVPGIVYQPNCLTTKEKQIMDMKLEVLTLPVTDVDRPRPSINRPASGSMPTSLSATASGSSR